MKLIACIALAASVALPTLAFAQNDNSPVTRAQVRAELVQLERAGYSPATGENPNYPSDIQAAEAKVASEQSRASAPVGGAATWGSSQSGSKTTAASNARPGCSGPASFCDPFFGN
jgi:type II secretory pathway pseudopilin PulG